MMDKVNERSEFGEMVVCKNDVRSLQAQHLQEITSWQQLEATIQNIVASEINQQFKVKTFGINRPSPTFRCVMEEMCRSVERMRTAPLVDSSVRGKRNATNRMSLSSPDDPGVRYRGKPRYRRYTIATDCMDIRSDEDFTSLTKSTISEVQSKTSDEPASDDECFEAGLSRASANDENTSDTKIKWLSGDIPTLQLSPRGNTVENYYHREVNAQELQLQKSAKKSLQQRRSVNRNSVVSSSQSFTRHHLDQNEGHRNVLYERYINSPDSWADGLTKYGKERLAELQHRKTAAGGRNRVRVLTAPPGLRQAGSALSTSLCKRGTSSFSRSNVVILGRHTGENDSDSSSLCSYDESFIV